MSALSTARDDIIALFRYGDDETRTIISTLKAAYDFEPKPGDPLSPYLALWQDGATDDDQFFRFQVRVYVEMSNTPRNDQVLFDGLCLDIDAAFRDDVEFVVTGWDTEWNGNLLVGMWDVLVGRTDVL